MDIASLVGCLVALACIAAAIVLGGGTMDTFIDPASVMVTIGGSLAVTLVCFPLGILGKIHKAVLRVFLNKPPNLHALVELLISLAESARREGLLSLERRLGEIDNEFIVLGLQMAVDGSQPGVIEGVLRCEMDATASRAGEGKSFFDTWGRMAPAFGMIGTLLGLIMMLGNLSDPDALGPGMAVAMMTTLYGAVIANAICIPFADKLNYLNRQEYLAMEIAFRGIQSIRDGESPRIVEQKLATYMDKKQAA